MDDAPDAVSTARIDRSERLLGLVVVLLSADQPIPRAAIRAGVPGYGEGRSDGAFERMFERDKDELRSMGIPVETVRDANDEVRGYRIPPDEYALSDLRLTAAERAAVAVAAQAWEQAALAGAADAGAVKLGAADAGAIKLGAADRDAVTSGAMRRQDLTGAPGLASIRLSAVDAALPELAAAIRERAVVTFTYRGRSDATARTRTVTPWGLRSLRGAWFCVGHDHDRADQRTFRLSRISGSVTSAKDRDGGPVPAVLAPTGFDIAGTPIVPESGEVVLARVRVVPGRALAVRRLSVDWPTAPADTLRSDEVTISAASMPELVAAICGAGSDAQVLDPPEAVDAVRAALSTITAQGIR